MKEVTFPVRVMHALGVKTLFVSNAAGGVNTNYLVGDLMIIRDHINLFPEHPLRGKNIDELGPRFPGMAEAYSKRLIQLAEEAGNKLNIPLQKGVYAGLQGPSFETPAEDSLFAISGLTSPAILSTGIEPATIHAPPITTELRMKLRRDIFCFAVMI